jgi:class 3 adenylate cyclase
MERIGAWLWRVHQRRFVVYSLMVATTFVSLTVLIPSIVVGSLYLDLRPGEGLVWFGSVFVLVGVAYTPLLALMGRRLAPLKAWIGGDHSDPVAAWRSLMSFPQAFAPIAGVVALVSLGATTFPLVLAMADTDGQGTAGLAIAYLVVTLTSTLLISSAAQILYRPAVADLASRSGPITALDDASFSIGSRLLVLSFVLASITAAAVPAMVLGTSSDSHDYVIALGGGAVWAAYISWVFHVGLLRPTLRPLTDVVDATVRVRRGDLATPVPVSSPDEIGQLAAAFNEMQHGLAEREALRGAFGSYVDPALAQRLLESGSAMFEGEELVVTVMFADVRDFSSYAEGVGPREAVDRLNVLFDVVVPAIHEHGGHANHYLGDGLLAVFGAPQPLERHADAAVAAAVDLQRRVRSRFGTELRLGVGINTGLVIAGTVGGGGRHEFTVIGDTVNTAARVEQLTKETGDAMLITEATRTALSTPRPRSSRRGVFELKGKASAVTVHAVNPFPTTTASGRRARGA